jgi:hypothetical protein
MTRIAAAKILIAVAALAASAPAQAWRDEATGFVVDPPAAFVTTPGEISGYDAAVFLDTRLPGLPPAIGLHDHLCEARFQQDQEGPRPRSATDAEAIRSMRRTLAEQAATVYALRVVDMNGTLGFEAEITPRYIDDAASKRAYGLYVATDKGVATLACVTTAAAFPAALPILRTLRQSLKPPR